MGAGMTIDARLRRLENRRQRRNLPILVIFEAGRYLVEEGKSMAPEEYRKWCQVNHCNPIVIGYEDATT